MFDFNFDWSKSMNAMKSLIKQSYSLGASIDGFVHTGAIDTDAYKEITGDKYEASESGTK
ncbi:XkdX family protein [Lactobacillus helveticus]|uniref:XkdX family protein n=1 Tax=Lactobacillus helveticus TaxID=1587 RepID=UPI0021ABF560|nr:XkdX family protein [Lactobacillus helveticus]